MMDMIQLDREFLVEDDRLEIRSVVDQYQYGLGELSHGAPDVH